MSTPDRSLAERRFARLGAWLPESMRDDPKKTLVLAGLLVVLAVFSLRYALRGTSVERATASLPRAATGGGGRTGAGSGVGASGGPGGAAQAQAGRQLSAWLDEPQARAGRNLFQIKLENFQSLSAKSDVTAAVAEENFWTQLARARDTQADQKARREILVENLQREAGRLTLQSTILGRDPQAIIDGSMVRVGQRVGDFEVLRIEGRRVIVTRDGVKLEIRMSE